MFNNNSIREVFQSSTSQAEDKNELIVRSISSRWTCCLICTLIVIAVIVATAVITILVISDQKMNSQTELGDSKCTLGKNAISSEIAAQILSYPFLVAPYEVGAVVSIYDGDLDANGSIPTPCKDVISAKNCLNTFYNLVAIEDASIPRTKNEFMTIVGANIIHYKGLQEICKQVTRLEECNKFGSSCFQMKAFLRMDLSAHYSYFLSQWIGQVSHLCGKMQEELTETTTAVQCIAASAWKHYGTSIECKKQFSVCLRTHGSQQHCRCSQHLLSCEEEFLSVECGEKTANLACEVVGNGLKNLYAVEHLDEDKACLCTSSVISQLKSANLTKTRLRGIVKTEDNDMASNNDEDYYDEDTGFEGVEDYMVTDV